MQNNVYMFSFDSSPLTIGGVIENKRNILVSGGKNMEDTLQRYKIFLCGEHSKKNTIENKLTAIRCLLEQTRGIINQKTILELKAWANTHYSHNTKNNRINAWNEFIRWYTGDSELCLKHIGFVETNQFVLDEKEIDRILQETKRDPLGYLQVLFLFDGALRPETIIDIRLNRRDGNVLYLDETKTGDTHIILSPMLMDAWDEYLKVRPTPRPGYEQFLLLKDNCKQPGTRYHDPAIINRRIKKIARQAGITKNITAYTIRRTSATLRQNKYSRYYMGDDKLVQMLFRHKDIKTTKRYDRTSDEDLKRYFDDIYNKQDKSRESPINSKVVDINLINTTLFSYHPSTLGNQLMARHIEKTNPALITLIKGLKKTAYENEAPIWKDIAERLEKPLRNWPEVNLNRIDLYIHEKETALIPGKVLSTGKLTKKVSIAAWSFSEKAYEKIKKAGGKTLTIEELVKHNPKGKDIRILG